MTTETPHKTSPDTNPDSKGNKPALAASDAENSTFQLPEVDALDKKTSRGISKRTKIVAGIAGVVTGLGAVIAGVVSQGQNTSATPEATPSASAPATPGPSTPESSPTSTNPESSPSTQTSETATPSSDQFEFELPNGETYKLPTAKELSVMSTQEKLEAIRIPEALMENREALYTAHYKMKEAIYNSFGTDEAYIAYRNSGGLDYAGHIMTSMEPLLQQLYGELSESDHKGMEYVAYVIANVLGERIDHGFTDLFSPYNTSIIIHSVEKDSPSHDITGVVSVTNSFDKEESEALRDIMGFTIEPQDETPFTARLTKIRYNEELDTVQAVSIQVKS